MYEGRDTILGGFSEQLDEYVGSLIREFNKLYASGQGLTGYEELTGLTGVKDADIPLDQLGLFEQPKSGVFSVLVQDTVSGTASTTEIRVDFSGTNGEKTTLNDIVDALNAIDGISAKLTSDNRLKITSTSAEKEFAFANDTANVLAALGLNTFFVGTDARTIGVNSTLKTDPGKLAVSASGIGADTENGVRLAAIPETRLSGLGNKSITESYRLMVTETMSKAGTIKAVATGDISYYTSLSAQRNSICGVDIDEETVSLLNFQRMYQATAKYVTVINEMLDALIAM